MEFNPKELLAQAQRASQEIQEKMRATIVEASAGGGSVTVKMNGQKQLLSVKIDPEAVKSGDLEMLQDLITAAVNEAAQDDSDPPGNNNGNDAEEPRPMARRPLPNRH